MKKVSKLLIVLMIINFIFASFFGVVKATDPAPENPTEEATSEETDSDTTEDSSSGGVTFSKDDYDSISSKGITTINTSGGAVSKKITTTESTMGSNFGKVSSIVTSAFTGIHRILSTVLETGGFYHESSNYGASETGLMTVNSLIFGEYLIFNHKPYETASSLNPEADSTVTTKTIELIKNVLSGWYVTFRDIGLVIAIPMFIISIIRALSTNSVRDSAVWKKILGRWGVAVVLLFFMQFILILLDTINDTFMDALWNFRIGLEENGYSPFEYVVFENLLQNSVNTGGFLSFAYAIEYGALLVIQILFFVKYFSRTFMLMFLFGLGPIFVIIHTIKFTFNGDSDALRDWLKKYASLLFIQPIHALFYLLFSVAASEIAVIAPLLGIFFLYGLFVSEKIAIAILDMQGESIFAKKN